MNDSARMEEDKMNEKPVQESAENQSEQSVQDEENTSDNRSKRRKRPRQLFSPDDDYESKSHIRRKQKKPKRFPFSSTAPDRPFDILPNGTPFCCDLCKSRYIVNRFSKKSLKNRRSKHIPAPQQKRDPVTGKTFTLCNACGNAFDRPNKPKKEVPVPSDEGKDQYIQQCKAWAKNLSEKFDLPIAVHLFCPVYKTRPCGCLQDYIEANGEESERQKRTSQLSAMASEARRLSALKCYETVDEDSDKSPQKNISDLNKNQESENELTENNEKNSDQSQNKEKKRKRHAGIGLGNGQKKSEKFATFVLSKRQHLKYGLHLCERATQKILCYSNNFLHKRLKTEEKRFRAQPMKGKARLGLLPSFDDMAKKRCCVDNCVMMALTHRTLLEEWRRRSKQSQIEARRVIAEMLTPSACARKNCYTFVTAVTGSSRTTVVQVNQQMLHTGGNREPPAHGLKKYHDSNKKKAVEISEPVQTMLTEIHINIMDKHREQLQQLQQQVSDQQHQLQQQQELQQQLLQQTLMSQGQNQTENVVLLQQINNQLNMHIQNTQRGLQQTLHNMAILMGTSKTGTQSGSKTGSSASSQRRDGVIQIDTTPSQDSTIVQQNSSQPQRQLNVVYGQQSATVSSRNGAIQLNTTNLSRPVQLNSANAINQNCASNSIVPQQASGTIRVINNTPQINNSQFILQPPSYSVVPQQNNLVNQSQQIIQTQQMIQPQQQIRTQQQIIQTPQQIIQTPQQIIQAPQQIIQAPQQMILTQQPNYQFSMVTPQSDQNIITIQSLPPDVFMANQNLQPGNIIHIANEEETRVQNVLQSAKQVNNQPVIVLEKVHIPSHHEGSKVAEVLSNVQVVEMNMPTSLDQVRNLNVPRPNNTVMEMVQNINQVMTRSSIKKSSSSTRPNIEMLDSAQGKKTWKSSSSKGVISSSSASLKSNTKGREGVLLSIQESSPPNMTVITSPDLPISTAENSHVNIANLPNIVSSNIPSNVENMYTATPIRGDSIPNYNDSTNYQSRSNQSTTADIGTVQSDARSKQLPPSGEYVDQSSFINRDFRLSVSAQNENLNESSVLNHELQRLLKAKMIKAKKVSPLPLESQLNRRDGNLSELPQSGVRSATDTVIHRVPDVNLSQNKAFVSSQNGSTPHSTCHDTIKSRSHKGKKTKSRISENEKPHHVKTCGITAPVLTSEYMNFSLPLSDVITMYTNTANDKQSIINNDQTQLQLSLQINPVSREGTENAYSSSTLNLGSILIIDPDNQNLIPETVKETSKTTTNVTSRKTAKYRKESDLYQGSGNLVIDEGIENRNLTRSRNSSSESHMTDVDNEVQQILQTNSKRGKNKQKFIDQSTSSSQPADMENMQQVERSNTLPFKPLMRSDTLIYSPSLSRSDTVQLSEDLERSDTIKLPNTEKSETYSLPVRRQKGKKKTNAKRNVGNRTEDGKNRQNLPSSGETSKLVKSQINNPDIVRTTSSTNNQNNPIILSGNLATADQQWLQRLVNDIQKHK